MTKRSIHSSLYSLIACTLWFFGGSVYSYSAERYTGLMCERLDDVKVLEVAGDYYTSVQSLIIRTHETEENQTKGQINIADFGFWPDIMSETTNDRYVVSDGLPKVLVSDGRISKLSIYDTTKAHFVDRKKVGLGDYLRLEVSFEGEIPPVFTITVYWHGRSNMVRNAKHFYVRSSADGRDVNFGWPRFRAQLIRLADSTPVSTGVAGDYPSRFETFGGPDYHEIR